MLSMRELLKLEKLVHGWLVSRTGLAVLEGVLNKNNVRTKGFDHCSR